MRSIRQNKERRLYDGYTSSVAYRRQLLLKEKPYITPFLVRRGIKPVVSTRIAGEELLRANLPKDTNKRDISNLHLRHPFCFTYGLFGHAKYATPFYLSPFAGLSSTSPVSLKREP